MANPTAQTRSFDISRDALAFTRDAIITRIFDAQFDHSPTLAMVFGRLLNADFGGVPLNGAFKDTQTGGESITHRVNLGSNSTAKTLSGPFDTVTTDPSDTVRNGWANWKHYSAVVTVSDAELLMNTGDTAISSLLEFETTNAIRSLADLVGDHLYQTGAGGTAITGIPTLINANNTADNIAQGTYAKWGSRGVSARNTAAGSVSFASGSFAAQGIADMRTAWLGCSEGAIQPRVITTTYPIFAFYEGSLQPQERFTSTTTADGGFQQLMFKGAPVFPDVKVATQQMFFLNPEYLKVRVLGGADFTAKPFIEAEQQEAVLSKIMLKCNTIVLDRRFGNKLTGITA